MSNNDIYIYEPIQKKSDAVPIWFSFPANKNIAMSSLGYLSIFKSLDTNPNVLPEMVFTDTSKTQLFYKNVKMIGFSFSFEFDFLGMFSILEKYSIPLKSQDRDETSPIIFGGGIVLTANPEPFADFFDVIIIGDGDVVINEIVDTLYNSKHLSKDEILFNLSEISGVYVPKNPKKNIKKRTDNLEQCLFTPIVAEDTIFSGNFLIEVARGCPYKCKFCLACYLNLPARYPSLQSVKSAINLGIKTTKSIGLLGALVPSHPQFDDIIEYIDNLRNEMDFNVSIASLRADKIKPETVKTLVKCGLKSTTIAIEAGSQRLRNEIFKNLTEDQILEAIKIISDNGLSALKIYAMIGLPTETDEDILELIALMKTLKKSHKSLGLTLSISSYVPKAHTPYERIGRTNNKILKKRLDLMKKELHKLGVNFKPTSLKWDYIQAILSRGDNSLTDLLIEVYKDGCSIGSWKKAFNNSNLADKTDSLDYFATRSIPESEKLPWSFIEL